MKKNILTELSRIREMMGILNEKIITNYDQTYDYKEENGQYFTKKKGSKKWIKLQGNSLETVKEKVFNVRSPKNSTKSQFKNEEEGNQFRAWVIQNYPFASKLMGLKNTGSLNDPILLLAVEKFFEKYSNSPNKPNKNLIISPYINQDYKSKIDFNSLSSQDSTYNVCSPGTEDCAQFVNNIRTDFDFASAAWTAYNVGGLGTTVYSSFKGLDKPTQDKMIKLWLDIHKNGGGKKNGPKNGEVKDLVSKLVPAKGTIKDLQINDNVGLFNPDSSYHERAFYEGGQAWFTTDENGKKIPGKTIRKGEGWGMNTHLGTVLAIKNGVPLIFHNIKGKVISDPPSNLRIAWIKRPQKNK